MEKFSEDPSSQEIISYLNKIEKRISRIENHLELNYVQDENETDDLMRAAAEEPESEQEREERLEFQIGEFWAAKAGIVILAIGIAFFLTFPYKNLPAVLPPLTGYFLVAVILGLSRYWRTSIPHISSYLLGGGLTLLYFSTLRLYFFSETRAVDSQVVEVILLVAVSVISLIVALRRKSVYLSGFGIIFGLATAVSGDSQYFAFILIMFISALTVYLKFKYGWKSLLLFGMAAVYLTFFVWMMNNPFLSRDIQFYNLSAAGPVFLLLYVVCFSLSNLLRGQKETEDFHVALSTSLNLIGGYGLFLLATLTSASSNSVAYNLAASFVFLILAILFWTREQSRYSTFLFAMAGYLALSVAILMQFKIPNSFVWLCWQSLLVVTTAVWFRSKFIILANFIIYIIIFAAYLIIDSKINGVSISYGIVALLSARILNWKKERLELRTEQMRNAYLLTALIIIPYALYFAVPDSYISVSWIGVAIVYYILSLMLKNKKYRWMALLTLLLTVFYVFIIGITSSDLTYKIISFIALGVVLLSMSIIYSKRKKSHKDDLALRH